MQTMRSGAHLRLVRDPGAEPEPDLSAADDREATRDAGPPPERRDGDVADTGAVRGERVERAGRQTAERERDAAEASRDRFSFLAEASRYLTESHDVAGHRGAAARG